MLLARIKSIYNKTDFGKYRVWFYLIVCFSALPIVLNIVWDYINSDPSQEFWKGLRLIDFLICGFCLIGGALCDRCNSPTEPSKDALCCGFLASLAGLGFYGMAKASSQATDVSGVYARDGFLMWLIVGFYFATIIYSMALMRKSYTKE